MVFGHLGMDNVHNFLYLIIAIGAFPVQLFHSQETLTPNVGLDL
jgi:hypothetical protein